MKIIGFSGKKQAGKDTAADTIYSAYPLLHNQIWRTAFAEALKDFCIDILGLSEDQCYGTNAQKDSPTHLRWDTQFEEIRLKYSTELDRENMPLPRSGYMTGREVLQVFGTDWFRRVYPNVWVDYPFRKVKTMRSTDLMIITDVRFPNEVQRIVDEGGIVIRINRPSLVFRDEHASETALDDYKFDHIIINDGSLEDYEATVLAVYNELF